MFDVFLSHNNEQKPAVREIAVRLREAGAKVWFDEWSLDPGKPWQEQIELALTACRTCAVFVGQEGLGSWQNEEMRMAIDRRVNDRDFRVIPVLLPGFDRPPRGNLPACLTATMWIEFRRTLQDQVAFDRLVAAIRGDEPVPPQIPSGRRGDSPYRGLRSFESEHERYFFGREALTDWLVDAIRPRVTGEANRFLAILGTSGAGKSSVAKAGLVPALRRNAIDGSANWSIRVCRWGSNPCLSLAEWLAAMDDVIAKLPNVRQMLGVPEDCPLEECIKQSDKTLHLLTKFGLGADDTGRRIVLLIDQFEEIFGGHIDEGLRRAAIANLYYGATIPNGRTIVILTMRADLYDRCGAYPEFAATLSAHQELLVPLTSDELRSAIERPARLAGCIVEPNLIDQLLADVGHEPGRLPLLQHVLDRLWREEPGPRLTIDTYQRIGGLEGALQKHADAVFLELDKVQQEICQQLLLRLTEPGNGSLDSALRVPREELQFGNEKLTQEILERLAAARLITIERGTHGKSFVELAHEALVRKWSRFRNWIDSERESVIVRRRLTRDAREWHDQNHNSDLLYTGMRLLQVEKWRQAHASELTQRERGFLIASRSMEDTKVRQTRLRRVGLAMGLLVLLAAGAAGLWWSEHQRTVTSDAVKRAVAETRQLLGQADSAESAERQIELCTEANQAARRATELAQNVFVTSEVRNLANRSVTEAADARDAAERNIEFINTIQDLSFTADRNSSGFSFGHSDLTYKKEGVAIVTNGGFYSLSTGEANRPGSDKFYADQFKSWGLDLKNTAVDKAAAAILRQPPWLIEEILLVLDEWALARRLPPSIHLKFTGNMGIGQEFVQGGDWKDIWDLADQIDREEGNELRVSIRNFLVEHDVSQDLAQPSEKPLLEADKAVLRDLMQRVQANDHSQTSTRNLLLLARTLEKVGQTVDAENLLRRATRVEPQEHMYWLALGELLERSSPPHSREAVACFETVRALRPKFGTRLARSLEASGKKVDAQDIYQQLCDAQPDNIWRWDHYLSSLQGERARATQACRDALKHHPKCVAFRMHLARSLSEQQLFDEAISEFANVLASIPEFAPAHFDLARAYYSGKKYPQAIAQFRQLLKLQPEYPNGHHFLGIVLLEQDEVPEAAEELRKATELRNTEVEALNFLGFALMRLEKWPAAVTPYRKILELDSNFIPPRYDLAIALLAQGLEAEALAELGKLIDQTPTDIPGYIGLSALLSRRDDVLESAKELRTATKYHGTDFDSHYFVGLALIPHRPWEAEARFRKALEAKPQLHAARYQLAKVIAQRPGRTMEAIAQLRKLIAQTADYPGSHRALGMALVEQNDHADAEVAFRGAIELDPHDLVSHYQLGLACKSQGKWKDAVKQFSKLLELDKGHAAATNELAWLLATSADEELRDYPRALQLAKRSVELKPDDGGCWNTFGVASYRMADWPAAKQALEKSISLQAGGSNIDWVFMAMTSWQLQQPEESLKWFAKTKDLTDHQKDCPNCKQEYLAFRDEAKKLLQVVEVDEAAQQKTLSEQQKKND